MNEIISSILSFLNSDKLTAWQVILTAVISSGLFWMAQGLFKLLGKLLNNFIVFSYNLIVRCIRKIYLVIKEFFFGSMNLNEFIEIEEKIEKGEKVTPWKKRKYNRSGFLKEQAKIRKAIGDVDIDAFTKNNYIPHLPDPNKTMQDLIKKLDK